MRVCGLFFFFTEFPKRIRNVAYQLPGLSGEKIGLYTQAPQVESPLAPGKFGVYDKKWEELDIFYKKGNKKWTTFILLHGQGLCYNKS